MIVSRMNGGNVRKRQKIEKTEKRGIEFVSTGCTLLNCALGGGFPLGRMSNIVGDKSTAKTALANEAITNFLIQYPKGAAAFREIEAAYDLEYARSMGVPVDDIDYGDPGKPLLTVEDFARDFEAFIDQQKKVGQPGIYVVDSLDALSDDAEMASDFGKASYGTAKARSMTVMFRKLVRKCERSRVLLLIISQVRENIGIAFGEKYRRSGGKALDFYASQILWLAHIKTLKKTIHKVERAYAVTIRAKVKKNKAGLNFREVEFDFIFGYGIDDIGASITWLEEVNHLLTIGLSSNEVDSYMKKLSKMTDDEHKHQQALIADAVKKAWSTIEISFLPERRKYA